MSGTGFGFKDNLAWLKERMRGPEEPLATSISYSVVPLTLASITFLSFFIYLSAKGQILGLVNRELETQTRQAADDVSLYFNQREEDARMLAESVLLRDYLKYRSYNLQQEAEISRGELSSTFSKFAKEKGAYSRISFWDLSGRERLYGSVENSAGTPRPDLPFGSIPALRQVVRTEPQGRGDGSYYFFYWTGVYDEQAARQGSVVLTAELAPVLQILRKFRIGRGGNAALLDNSGRPLLATSPASPGATFKEAEIAGTPWRVRLTVDSQEFLAPLRRIARIILVVSVGAGLLIFLWITYAVRKATSPIEEMAEGTQRIAAGDLDFHVALPSVSELRMLGESFNDMAAKLKERNLDLQSRIRILTNLKEMEETAIRRLDEELILRACLRSAAQGLSLSRTALYWVDTRRNEIVGRYTYDSASSGFTEEAFQRKRRPLGGEDILSFVVRTRSAVLVPRPLEDPRVSAENAIESKTPGFVLAPICGKDQIFGVLAADNFGLARPLRESDKDGLALFANAAGLAIENFSLLKNIAESEARHRTVLENSPVAILGLSKEHHITTWNPGAETIFGYKPDDIIGKPLRALFPPEADEEVSRLTDDMVRNGFVRDHPIPGLGKGGKRLHLSLSWGGAHKEFWTNREWTIVIRDVTEAKELQRRLVQSEKLSVVGQLISGIAHELNNPLQAIIGLAYFLAEPSWAAASSPKEQQSQLKEILNSALRCREIIDRLLVFVRKGEVEKDSIALGPIIRSSLKLLQHKLKKTDAVRVKCLIPKDTPKVSGSPQQIQQIFINLINNACDSMAAQSTPKMITIRASSLGGSVRVEVEDSGPGVPMSHRSELFEPFFTTKREGHGTGLGLTICRQIVRDHKGEMGFLEGASGGALFWLELPVAGSGAKRPSPRTLRPAPVPGKRVLLVDDEPAVLSVLRKVLDAEGGEVVPASSLKEARQKAKAGPVDLVIADVQLGDGNGVNLYHEWAQHSPHPRPQFLFVTGEILNDSTQAIERLGLPLLHKPVDIREFQDVLRSLFAVRKPAV